MMKRVILCCFLLILPSAALSPVEGQVADVGKRVALVIGNGAYERPEDRLPNPTNDARALAAKLDGLGFDVIEAIDLDYASMRRALRDFDRALQHADAGLFFYAGHGMEYQGRNYLFPTDAVLESEGDVGLGLIDAAQILHIMETRVPTRLLFLDACRNNPLARRFRSALGGTRSLQIGTGLARIDAAVGTFIAYATAPGQLAEDGAGAHSPFSAAMLHHLDEPGLDVEQLMRRVRNDVLAATDERQIPWNSSSLRGSFVLNTRSQSAPAALATPASGPGDAAAGIPQPTSEQDDRDAWAFARQLDTAKGFEAYIAAHCPDGRYCGFAQAALSSKTPQREQQAALDDAVPRDTGHEPADVPSAPMVELANALAEGWGQRRYRLQDAVRGHQSCRRNERLARVDQWRPADPKRSPITVKEMASKTTSKAMVSTGFDVAADLAVHVAENELYLVESKRHVGSARGFCRLAALDRGLFRDLVANAASFASQGPQTLTYGFDRISSIEFASGLVTLQGSEGQRTCLAFVGVKGLLSRVDGFYCRAVGQTIDASEVDAILSRIKIKGVIG